MFFLLFFIILLIFSLGLTKFGNIINPVTCFSGGFLLALMNCLIYYNEWDMNKLGVKCFTTISAGFIFFYLACFIVNKKYQNTKPLNNIKCTRIFNTNNIILLLFILFQIITLYILSQYKINVTGTTDLAEAINEIDHEYKFGDTETYRLPVLLANANFAVSSLNYYFMFILAKMLVFKEWTKKMFLILIIVLIGCADAIMTGSRGNLVYMMLYFVLVYVILLARTKSQKLKFSWSLLLKLSLAVVCVVVLFFLSSFLIGRDVADFDPFYYIAVYCGAQIKNLDFFISDIPHTIDFTGSYTFKNIFPPQGGSIDLLWSFRYNGAYFLGNVYTCFSAYYLDFGIFGSVILCFIMGLIMQYLFEKANRKLRLKKKLFDFHAFLYAYFSLGLTFNFFAERFYNLFSWYTLKMIIFIWLINKIILKFSKLKRKCSIYKFKRKRSRSFPDL